LAKILAKIAKNEAFVGSAHSAETIKRKAGRITPHAYNLAYEAWRYNFRSDLPLAASWSRHRHSKSKIQAGPF